MADDIIKIKNPPYISYSASVVGKKEYEGPLGKFFDVHDESDKFGMQTWEKAEGELQRLAMNLVMSKGKYRMEDIDVIFAGDLMNQCVSSTYGLLTFDIPYIGLFGACSTAAEGLMIAAMTCGADYFKRCAVVTSSHYCSAERQFRLPLEYGGQRTPTAQWTVTGAGAFLVESQGKTGDMRITEALPGITVDKGIADANNMGAAMAPAAIDTLSRYFQKSGHKPEDFDLILTGDLGYEGYSIVKEIMESRGHDMTNYNDCGLLIYYKDEQDVHAGGSGCGCSAVVMASHILKQGYRDILFLGTGALMSPLSVKQGQSIAGIAHLVRLQNG